MSLISGGLYCWIGDGTTTSNYNFVNSTNLAINNSTWYNFTMVFDGTQPTNDTRLKVYKNGALLTWTTVRTIPTTLATDLTLNTNIGARNGTNEFSGKIDEVAFWHSIQNPIDIYNSGVPTDLTSLNPLAWYRMGDNGVYKDPQWLLPNNENKDKVSNYSMEFDGVNDYIDCGDVTSFNNTSTFTYSGWYKQTTIDIVSYMLGSFVDVNNRLLIYTWTDGTMNFQIRKSGGSVYARFDYSTVVTAEQWFHLAVVYDGIGAANADKVKIYINGISQTLSFIGTFPSSTSLGTNITTVGKVSDATQTWNGNIDEVSIFNNSLTQQSITDLYNGGTPTTISGATNYWKMGEDATFNGSNWTLPDSVGTNDGTSANMTIEDRVGTAPSSSNNTLSFNMDLIDRAPDTPPS